MVWFLVFFLYFLYVLTAIIFIVDCYLIIRFIERVYCTCIAKQPPMVATNNKLRQAVVSEINTHYKNAKNICDFGSGFGGLARFIANNTKATVYGLENMPFSVCVSKITDLVRHTKNKTIWTNGFEYMDKTNVFFDVVVAYLGPDAVQKLSKYKNKMRVLILIDFQLKSIKPIRVINVGSGFTRYGGKLYPNKLFIYEF